MDLESVSSERRDDPSREEASAAAAAAAAANIDPRRRPPDFSADDTASTNGSGTEAAVSAAGGATGGVRGSGGFKGGEGPPPLGRSRSSSGDGSSTSNDRRRRPPPQSKPNSTSTAAASNDGGSSSHSHNHDDDSSDAISDVVASLILGPDEEQRLLIEKFKATAAEAREAGRELLPPSKIVEEATKARRAVQEKMRAARDMWMSGHAGGSMVTPTGVSSTSLGMTNDDDDDDGDDDDEHERPGQLRRGLSASMPAPQSRPMTDDDAATGEGKTAAAPSSSSPDAAATAPAASSSSSRPPRHPSPVPVPADVERRPSASSSRSGGGASASLGSQRSVTSEASSGADDSSDGGGAGGGPNRRAYGTFDAAPPKNDGASPPRRPVTGQREAGTAAAAAASDGGNGNDMVTRSGIVWKRRSGFGKFDTKHAWERRRLILRDTKLIYFSSEGGGGGDGGGGGGGGGGNNGNNNGKQNHPPDGGGIGGSGGFKLPSTLSDLKSEFKSAIHPAKSKVNSLYNQAAEKTAACSLPSLDVTGSGSGENLSEAPRGSLDLVREDATVSPTFGTGGAPTPFALSIKINGETKWKFCLDSHREQVEWLVSISNVVVRRSVEKHIEEQVAASGGGGGVQVTWKSLEDPSFSIHGTPSRRGGGGGGDGGGDDGGRISSPASSPEGGPGGTTTIGRGDGTDEQSPVVGGGGGPSFESEDLFVLSGGDRTVASRKHENSPSATPSSGYFVLTGRRVVYVLLLANVSMFVTTSSTSWSSIRFWFCLVMFNVAAWLCLEEEHKLVAAARRLRSKAAMAAATAASFAARPRPPPEVDASMRSSSAAAVAASVDSKLLPSVVAPPDADKARFVPVAGTSTVQIADEGDEPVNGDGVYFPGWRSLTGSEMMVRSVGYEQSRKKVPSVGSLYECAAVDIFDSYSRVMDMGQKVQLPGLGFECGDAGGGEGADGATPKWHSPDVFIVSVAIPTEARLGSSVYDGAGFSVIIYCTMREETRRILERITQPDYDPARDKEEWADDDEEMARKVNAVRLFEEWCRRSPSDPTFQGRFKLVPDALNLVEIGLPSYITKYKNKPVLIKRSGVTGTLYCHPGVKEFHINLHAFPYLAKQAFGYMKDNYFEKILVNVAFVIEGRNDDELPEVVIGAFQLCYPKPAYAIHADDFFRGTCPKSF